VLSRIVTVRSPRRPESAVCDVTFHAVNDLVRYAPRESRQGGEGDVLVVGLTRACAHRRNHEMRAARPGRGTRATFAWDGTWARRGVTL
jgi:hypothetical protein